MKFGKHLKQPLEVFYKKGVLENFAKFTGKHLCQRLSFNRVARLRSATLLKGDFDASVSLRIFKKLWRTRFL